MVQAVSPQTQFVAMGRFTCVIAVDESYVRQAEVLVYSLLTNASVDVNLYVLVSSAAQAAATAALRDAVARAAGNRRCSCDLFICNIDRQLELIGNPPNLIRPDVSNATYLKFFIPDLVPDDWALYLDCDAIVVGDVRELAGCAHSNCALAAVRNATLSNLNHWTKLRSKYRLQSSAYFNAGLLLMNLRLMRQKDASSLLMQFIRDNPDLIYFQDQDAWNVVFNGDVVDLPRRLNFHDFSMDYSVESLPCQLLRVALGVSARPGIELQHKQYHFLEKVQRETMPGGTFLLHYSASPKPWTKAGSLRRAYASIWWSVARQLGFPSPASAWDTAASVATVTIESVLRAVHLWRRDDCSAEILDFSRSGDLEGVKAAISHGASVDVRCRINRSTPLICAAKRGYVEMVEYLLDKGAAVNLVNLDGNTALDDARDGGNPDIAELLQRRGAASARTISTWTLLWS